MIRTLFEVVLAQSSNIKHHTLRGWPTWHSLKTPTDNKGTVRGRGCDGTVHTRTPRMRWQCFIILRIGEVDAFERCRVIQKKVAYDSLIDKIIWLVCYHCRRRSLKTSYIVVYTLHLQRHPSSSNSRCAQLRLPAISTQHSEDSNH